MKSQPKFSQKGVSQILFSICVLLVLSLFVVSDAQAKRPRPDPGPSAQDNNVQWSADVANSDIREGKARLCTPSQIALDGSSGKFTCQLNNGDIFYDLYNMDSQPIHRRGDDWRCNDGIFMHGEPDIEYSFSWYGDCSTGCDVTIVNAFTNSGTMGGSVGRMTIEGFTTAMNLAGGNPFAEPQSLLIDYLHVTLFSAKGRDKVLAICKLTPRESYPVTFVTTPVPIIVE